jgi:hypothetical protein
MGLKLRPSFLPPLSLLRLIAGLPVVGLLFCRLISAVLIFSSSSSFLFFFFSLSIRVGHLQQPEIARKMMSVIEDFLGLWRQKPVHSMLESRVSHGRSVV